MSLLKDIKNCRICEEHLPLGPRPVVVAHPESKILIIGQAPGSRVHASGIPWADQSGKRLRTWLGVDDDTFYNAENFALVPMGFCFPGSGKGGDLPPRPECAPKWHDALLNMMPKVELTLLFGMYAQKYYLKEKKKKTLTAAVKNWQEYQPGYLPLPHPSPRNQHWWKKNPWFEVEVIPFLLAEVSRLVLNVKR